MYATINEALDAYKKELREYLEWINPLKERYQITDAAFAQVNFPRQERVMAEEWTKKLKAMTEVLGLTKEEVSVIDTELGVEK